MAATEGNSGSETTPCDNEMTLESKSERQSESSSSSTASPGGNKDAVVDPKVCGVCGDKALGNNFNAVTCESCKAFFRRNALRTKEFVCPFSNNCKVDAITRRFCQRCRLKKCFDIGMKKEWIMTDEEKKMKRHKIEQNRKKRTSLENSGGSCASSEQSPGGGKVDVELDDAPSSPKRMHYASSSESQLVQRLSAPIISVLTSSSVAGGDRQFGANSDENSTPPRIAKQPMGPHNHNQDSYEQKHSPIATSRKKSGVAKTKTEPVIAPHANSPHSVVSGSESPLPYSSSHSAVNLATDLSASNHHNHPQQQQHEHYHYPQHHRHCASAHGWMERDSSNGSLSPPSSHLKYPPNKRARLYERQDHIQAHPASNDESNPLLSSLIQPGRCESSPDHVGSPSQMVHHHNHRQPNSEECDIQSMCYDHASSTRHNSHAHFRSEYGEDYEHQSPPHHCSYQNGYQQQSQYSPPHPAYHHHHHHHHLHGTDNQVYQQNQQHQHVYQRDNSTQMSAGNSMDSILSIAIAAEFNSFGMLGSGTSRDLNKAEQAKLNELLLASQALHDPVDAERPLPSSTSPLHNVVNLTEIAIRRLIKMSKKISGFKNMCQEDQIALLKGSCTEMMILRSVVTYDPDRDSWQIPHSNPGYNINLGVLKEARGNLYEEHQRFVKSFRSEWRKDENIMIILCAITLFTPERHMVIHRDVVKLEQDSYYYLLKRYLESIFSNGCEGKSNYLQLIRKVAELRALNSSHVRVFLEMNPKEVEPLLIEIFDLK